MRGSVRKRGTSWRAVIDLPSGEGGKRQQRTATFATKREAEEWLARTATEAGTGTPSQAAGAMTVRGYLETWLDGVAPSIKPQAAEDYRAAARRVCSEMGDALLKDLAPPAVQAAVNRLAARYAPGTVRRDLGVFRSAARQAVDWGYIKEDPTRRVRGPREPEGEMACWDEEQAVAFLREVKQRSRYGLFFHLALATGMRYGELAGLQWNAVDLDRGVVHVRCGMSRLPGRAPVLENPKTKASRRAVTIDPSTVAALRRHREQQEEERVRAGDGWQDRNLVLGTATGGFVDKNNLARLLRGAAAVAGVPRIRIHDLRHTHATILLRQRHSVKEVAQRLGHADAAMVLRRYAHVLPDQQEEVARTIGRVLFGGDIP